MQSLLCPFMLFFMCFSLSSKSEQLNWETHVQRKHIQVDSATSASGQFWVRAQTQLNTDISALLVLLNDTPNTPLWIANLESVKVLKRPVYHQAIVHSRFRAPWPVSKRDMITHSFTRQDPQSLVIHIDIHNAGHKFPNHSDYIRMQGVTGRWTLTPLAYPAVRIEYTGSANPAGDIPTWLANQTLLNATMNTFLNLRQRLPLPQYQNKPLRGIAEPVKPGSAKAEH